MRLEEDIKKAKSVIQETRRTNLLYNESSCIYKCTNENMRDEHYVEELRDHKKILSVIGSGDQIINSILMNANKIDAFDISRFPKYFLELKLAAIKVLNYEEYLSFFFGSRPFNRCTYKKVLEAMNNEARDFWKAVIDDRPLSIRSPRRMYSSNLFSYGNVSEERAISLNPYLEEQNYDILQFKIPRVSIRYFRGNILDMADQLTDSYDLVNLSNIGMYQQDQLLVDAPFEVEPKFKNFVKKLRLNPDGKVLNYLMSYFPGSLSDKLVKRHYEVDPDFRVLEINNQSSGERNDALLVYQKRK